MSYLWNKIQRRSIMFWLILVRWWEIKYRTRACFRRKKYLFPIGPFLLQCICHTPYHEHYRTKFIIFIVDRVAFVKGLNCQARQDNLNNIKLLVAHWKTYNLLSALVHSELLKIFNNCKLFFLFSIFSDILKVTRKVSNCIQFYLLLRVMHWTKGRS